ncbi:MAG: T9SS type A sorting domain-containing protein [Bacteroidales bacterium]|jgi:hypothetical protein|nr:T9SS type A sorting domain-containing protein [Bacteroidales bacterium]
MRKIILTLSAVLCLCTVNKAIAQRVVLHEVFTSSTCAPCTPGNVQLKNVLNQVNDDTKWVCIKYQYYFPGFGDPYYTTEGKARGAFYGEITGIPSLIGDGGIYRDNPAAYTVQKFDALSAVPAIGTMTASVTLTGQTVSLKQMTIIPVMNMNNPNLRFFAAIVEKKTVNNAKTNGETEFIYVMKKFLTNISGDTIAPLEANKPMILKDYTYTFNGSYRLPIFATSRDTINHSIEHSVENLNNIMVVYWLQDIVTKEVYQAGKTDPNPGYTPFYYTVTTSVNNSSAGRVAGGPYYTPNTMAHLVAYYNNGYRFSHWSDGVTDNPRTFKVTQDTSFMAIFSSNTQGQYYVYVTANDTSMGTVTGSGDYTANSTATITAIPNNGYRFVQWNDGNEQTPRTITVTQDTILTAEFAVFVSNMYHVTVFADDPNMGSVSGGGDYTANSIAVIEAIPNRGFRFKQWHDGNTQNPRTITVTQDISFSAEFEEIKYNLSLSANDATRGTFSGDGEYTINTVVPITATPHTSYRFVGWSDGNKNSQRSITITKDIALVAIFGKENMYYVYAAPNNTMMGSVTGSNDYDKKSLVDAVHKAEYSANSVATITAIPNPGYRFVRWNDGSTSNPLSFTVMDDYIITAFFDETTGITDMEISAISVYPNPARDNIHIILPENIHHALFTLYDMQGKVLIRKKISNQKTISVSNLAKGVYIYNVTTDKQKHTGKLIINVTN